MGIAPYELSPSVTTHAHTAIRGRIADSIVGDVAAIIGGQQILPTGEVVGIYLGIGRDKIREGTLFIGGDKGRLSIVKRIVSR